jgi:hypothetical protein
MDKHIGNWLTTSSPSINLLLAMTSLPTSMNGNTLNPIFRSYIDKVHPLKKKADIADDAERKKANAPIQ